MVERRLKFSQYRLRNISGAQSLNMDLNSVNHYIPLLGHLDFEQELAKYQEYVEAIKRVGAQRGTPLTLPTTYQSHTGTAGPCTAA